MSDLDFSGVEPNSWMRATTSPVPERSFRGVLLAVPSRFIARQRRSPDGDIAVPLVVSITIRLSLLDERRLRAAGLREPMLDLVVAATHQASGQTWSRRPKELQRGVHEPCRNFDEASDAEAERAVYTWFANPDLGQLFDLPAQPGILLVTATLGPYATPSLPVEILLP